MPTAKKICRVCGEEYEACHTAKREASGFRWQDVSCSPECGAEYLRQVNEARNPKPKRVKVKPAPIEVVPEVDDVVEEIVEETLPVEPVESEE